MEFSGWDALDLLALNAMADAALASEQEILPDQIARWQRVFRCSETDAVDLINQHRSDLTRKRVSNEHWALVRQEKEAEGYDRELYEYQVQFGKNPNLQYSHIDGCLSDGASLSNNTSYLLKLEGPLDEPQKVQTAANLSELPKIERGFGDRGEAIFCRIDNHTKQAIGDWLSRLQTVFRPTYIRLSKARKELSNISAYPTLGIETTLPQYRSQDKNTSHLPAQDQYPVWYFFYGTLGDVKILSDLLNLPAADRPILRPAKVENGRIKTWGGKYKALVDGPTTSYAQGWAYEVQTGDMEEALLLYETEQYEVVRCAMTIDGEKEVVKGCTFRFIGSLGDDL